MPAPVSLNAAACSSTRTSHPARAQASAAARPPMPPPAMARGRGMDAILRARFDRPSGGLGHGSEKDFEQVRLRRFRYAALHRATQLAREVLRDAVRDLRAVPD